jgi:hypothetical protein
MLACLNSRTLTPFSSDVKGLNVLNPLHYLLGTAFGAVYKVGPMEASIYSRTVIS